MIAWLRTAGFSLLFYGGSVLFVLATPISAAIGRGALVANVHGWIRWHRWVARVTLGITCRFENRPPPGQYFFAAKHHAMLETFELALELGDPVIVIKRELSEIPLWGWAARRFGAIIVDRDASAPALRQMIREAKAALAAGRSVLIFPEGTRVPTGAMPALKSGFAGIYRALGLPVVPIAIDSGRVWPKHGPKRGGVVTFRFGDPEPPGLPRPEIEARVHDAINVLEPR
jgi:1-acyl-sn-glycerol-3-phosphate acyltransferase